MKLYFPVFLDYSSDSEDIIWEIDSDNLDAPAKGIVTKHKDTFNWYANHCKSQKICLSAQSYTGAFSATKHSGVQKDWAMAPIQKRYNLFSHKTEQNEDKAFTLSVIAYEVVPVPAPDDINSIFSASTTFFPTHAPALKLCSEWQIKVNCSGEGPLFQIVVDGRNIERLTEKAAKEYVNAITPEMMPKNFREAYYAIVKEKPKCQNLSVFKNIYKKPVLLELTDDRMLLAQAVKMDASNVKQDEDSVFGVPRHIIQKMEKRGWANFDSVRRLLDIASVKEVDTLLDDLIKYSQSGCYILDPNIFFDIFLNFPSWKISDHKILLDSIVSSTPINGSQLPILLECIDDIQTKAGRAWDFKARPPYTVSLSAAQTADTIVLRELSTLPLGDIFSNSILLEQDGYVFRTPKDKEEFAWDMLTLGYHGVYNTGLTCLLVRKKDREDEPLTTLLYFPRTDTVDIQGDRTVGMWAADIFREKLKTQQIKTPV